MKKTVMIVEDSPHVRELYEQAVTERMVFYPETEYDIIANAADCAEGWDAYQAVQPDICLIDYSLPDKTGLWLAEEILKQNTQAHLCISVTEVEQKHLSIVRQWLSDYPLAVIGVLVKPIQPALLWAYLERSEHALGPFEWDEKEEDWDGISWDV